MELCPGITRRKAEETTICSKQEFSRSSWPFLGFLRDICSRTSNSNVFVEKFVENCRKTCLYVFRRKFLIHSFRFDQYDLINKVYTHCSNELVRHVEIQITRWYVHPYSRRWAERCKTGESSEGFGDEWTTGEHLATETRLVRGIESHYSS